MSTSIPTERSTRSRGELEFTKIRETHAISQIHGKKWFFDSRAAKSHKIRLHHPLIVAPTPSTSSSSAGAQKKRIVHVPIIKGWLTGIPEASTPASVAPGLPSGSHPNLRTVSMPQPSSSEQPLITEDVSRSAVASAELTRITEKSSEFQPDSM
jgi:hypothetical protein